MRIKRNWGRFLKLLIWAQNLNWLETLQLCEYFYFFISILDRLPECRNVRYYQLKFRICGAQTCAVWFNKTNRDDP